MRDGLRRYQLDVEVTDRGHRVLELGDPRWIGPVRGVGFRVVPVE